MDGVTRYACKSLLDRLPHHGRERVDRTGCAPDACSLFNEEWVATSPAVHLMHKLDIRLLSGGSGYKRRDRDSVESGERDHCRFWLQPEKQRIDGLRSDIDVGIAIRPDDQNRLQLGVADDKLQHS